MTLVLNNSGMASEVRDMPFAEAEYGASNLGGDYAAIARALGGYAERVVDPNEIRPALIRAANVTRDGKPALVEFVTAREMALSTSDILAPPADRGYPARPDLSIWRTRRARRSRPTCTSSSPPARATNRPFSENAGGVAFVVVCAARLRRRVRRCVRRPKCLVKRSSFRCWRRR